MAISSPKLLILFSLCFILTLDLASASSSCDHFQKCVFTTQCWEKLKKPWLPNNYKMKQALAGLCKAIDCAEVIKKSYGRIPDSSPVPAECASLPVTGHPTQMCKEVLRRIFKREIRIPFKPHWLRISFENVYSTICHVQLCLEGSKMSVSDFKISDALQEGINLS
ncbi:UNVERIFIED_CONTAM: hypothetical protein RMT77_005457 [Armadillidium vulgare]